jgi:predicted alpha/beta superfamily hydrolase
MMSGGRLFAAVAWLILSGSAAMAQPFPDGAMVKPPATLLKSTQWDFTSKVNGRAYRVQVAMPLGPPPPTGYPVLYVTDSAGFFGAFAAASRVRTMGAETRDAIVVGIGYPEDDMTVQMTRRTLDLTPSTDKGRAESMAKGGRPGEFGGSADFLKIIQTEIEPRVAAVARINPADRTLYGHSLGGLFALDVLFSQPGAFRTYLVSSPTIWWDGKTVLAGEAGFARQVTAGTATPRIYILVGGTEQTAPPPPYPPGVTREAVEAHFRAEAMVDNAKALAARLKMLKGASGYEVKSDVFAGESHMSVPFASLNPMLTFALAPAARPTP